MNRFLIVNGLPSPWSAPPSTRGTACPTARTASRRTLRPSVQDAANPLPRRQWSLWTLNGIASASGEFFTFFFKPIRLSILTFCRFSGARTAESQLLATPLPLRTICRCAPSARVLRNRVGGGWVSEVGVRRTIATAARCLLAQFTATL